MDQETKQFLEKRFTRIDEQFTRIDERFSMVDEQLAALRSEMTTLATNTGEMINGLATHIDERFEELTPTVRDVESHEKRIKFLEDRLPKLAKA